MPNTAVVAGDLIVDPNGNVQQWLGPNGTTGAIPPVFASTRLAFTADGTGGWTCRAVLEQVALPTGVIALPVPQFVNDTDGLDPNLIRNDMITAYQAATGRTLQPAQAEMLLVNLAAYRESLVRNAIQYAAIQNLLAYSSYPFIDYLGALLGVTRMAAQGATATIQFTLVAAQAVGITIPAGTLVGTADGVYQFAIQSALTIAAGATAGVVNAVCTTPGAGTNNYAVGQINQLLTPNALVATVSNTTISNGGFAPETDDHLRARIQAAPNQFSAAGPSGAYRFFALGADPSIVDVLVSSPQPGTVSVYILTGPITIQPAVSPNNQGIASSGLLAEVLAVLNSTSVRPLTDTVQVLAVTEVDYQITGTVTLYADADPASTTAAVNNAAAQFAIALASRVQRDIVPSQIIEALSVAGVYEVVLTAPVYTQLSAGQWANCIAINLTIVQGAEHS
jgi:phage-related baseplate assembly protein